MPASRIAHAVRRRAWLANEMPGLMVVAVPCGVMAAADPTGAFLAASPGERVRSLHLLDSLHRTLWTDGFLARLVVPHNIRWLVVLARLGLVPAISVVVAVRAGPLRAQPRWRTLSLACLTTGAAAGFIAFACILGERRGPSRCGQSYCFA